MLNYKEDFQGMSWRWFGADYFDCKNNKMVLVDTVWKIELLHRLDKDRKAVIYWAGVKEFPNVLFFGQLHCILLYILAILLQEKMMHYS